MIKRITVSNYKLLRDIHLELDAFNILIGPNASGKSTLLDVLAFLQNFVRAGANNAVFSRVGRFDDLTFQHRGGAIEIETDMQLGEGVRARIGEAFARYRIVLRANQDGRVAVAHESLWLHFPQQDNARRLVCERKGSDELNAPILAEDSYQQNPNQISIFESGQYAVIYVERDDADPLTANPAAIVAKLLEDDLSILQALFDPHRNAAGFYVREMLTNAINPIRLDPARMAKPQPVAAGKFRGLAADGANIAAAIKHIQEKDPDGFEQWIFHVRNVLSDIEHIYPFEQGDQSLGFELRYQGYPKDEFVKAESLSDGTLRFLGLTLLAYLPAEGRIYLVEEPENGIHPPAIESVFKRLSSVNGGQVLVATHSPHFLLWAGLRALLLLSRNAEEGDARIMRGDDHPLLMSMNSPLDLPALFESGILSEVLG